MPIIAMFHEKSGGFSVLQFAGTISSMVYVNVITARRIKLKVFELAIFIFGVILVFNNGIYFILNSSVSNFGFALRNILPLLLYFYLRRVVKTRLDLDGILQTFLIASIIPMTIMLYEFFFAPIKEVYTNESRGGFARLSGFYADIFSYMAYVIGDFVIISYFLLRGKISFTTLRFVLFFGLIIIGLLSVNHQASWIVFVVILVLFMWFSLGSKVSSKVWGIILIGIAVGGGFLLESYIKPLFNKELSVYRGVADQDKAFNGRIVRWKVYFDRWEDLPFGSHLLGVGASGSEYSKIMMSGGMHSDYVRFLFTTGYLGIFMYLLFYVSILARTKDMEKPEKFLVLSGIAIMLLYAVSANPFGSSGSLVYLTMAIFAFATINKKIIYGSISK